MDRPMITDEWCGWEIRFVQMDDGEWWAVLKDICDALDLDTWHVSQRLYPDDLDKVTVERTVGEPLSRGVSSYNGVRRTQRMTVVSEEGIIDALLDSRRLEARKLRRWIINKLRDIRRFEGLHGYQVLHLTDKCYQDDVDMFWDDESERWRSTHICPNGDIEIED